jgi:hypothetical protein
MLKSAIPQTNTIIVSFMFVNIFFYEDSVSKKC